MKYAYKIIILLVVCLFTSCEDWFDIRPESERVLEDSWNNEEDVLSVIASCYRAMNEPTFMEKLIAWGELRSDNVIGSGGLDDNMKHIMELKLTSANEQAKWSPVYEVINYCNTVLYYAPGVRKKDPNFTEGELRAYLAEAKGVRAVCYFLLVRTFGAVPLLEDPVVDDTEEFEKEQTPAVDIINFLINDLRSVENSAMLGWEDKKYDKGRITQNAIWAILSDLYLWKNDYDSCIIYCDKVLDNTKKTLTFESSTYYNKGVFIDGNSTESIFELQFDLKNINNYVINEMYGVMASREGKNNQQLLAFDFSSSSSPLFSSYDLRGRDAFFPNKSAATFPITKYVAYRNRVRPPAENVIASDYTISSNASNWIFYRLSDIYLMKAEALVERASGNDLKDAHTLVSKTYDRANPDLTPGSLPFSNDQGYMRDLVFDERQREFIFEGKRYFDLLRRVHRENSVSRVVNTYLLRKYIYMKIDETTTKSRLSEINALYMPINKEEMGLNKLLKQNPFYLTNESKK